MIGADKVILSKATIWQSQCLPLYEFTLFLNDFYDFTIRYFVLLQL